MRSSQENLETGTKFGNLLISRPSSEKMLTQKTSYGSILLNVMLKLLISLIVERKQEKKDQETQGPRQPRSWPYW